MIKISEVVTVRENNNIRIIDVNGDLDRYVRFAHRRLRLTVAAQLRKELESLVRQGIYKLIINLSNIEYLGVPSIGVLVSISAQVRQKGGGLKVCGLADIFQRTFDLVGASKVIEIYNSEADAINSFFATL